MNFKPISWGTLPKNVMNFSLCLALLNVTVTLLVVCVGAAFVIKYEEMDDQ